ncbi:hypothetical protein [Cyanobacterium aponinum]|uniref:Uncharacterized protein n=1 Tax=Cyanobacterium aponinum 0216 TaxID=2676140 RepID=A0A844GWB0_9CHRO|nr:hypothetical protein [Cyanobacterium aponinum]MTF39321.1 hypothetical protein [Cyanobacterium aponinum 0216]
METATLKEMIKESIREVLHEERLSLIQSLIPPVNDEEKKEIEGKFGHPHNYNEANFVEMNDWLND